ncbi:TATA element modulatory factor 1 TATA binding protein [Macrophomina phaseolina MS6]|uniref:TATA element modulatory factor 1 TATA binding protein n=1 Tax=Macrophomina phaseolina (strain MS6) TaxID=1126212 RepID=K2RA34_MACPH|nr:TATA element modulatory factor 1 TATA binding protein [Macrophomina phaseolina MS6]
MSAPAKPKQPQKGWGSFLQGAVAGLESRLDTILAEDDQASARSRADDAVRRKLPADQGVSRTPSRSRTNDRLQERLAKAVKSDAQRSGRPSSELPSRTGTPNIGADTSRTSLDSKASEPRSSPPAQDEKAVAPRISAEGEDSTAPKPADDAGKTEDQDTSHPGADAKLDVSATNSAKVSVDAARADTPIDPPSRVDTPSSIPENSSHLDLAAPFNGPEDVAALRESYEALSRTHREEMTAHLERIDALQSKLKYLSSQAVSQARTVANEAEQGSVEKKLAEKDEQIALLMEEGQALSKKELTHLNSIKKFRAKVGQDEKTIVDLRKKLSKAEANASDAIERARRAEAAAKTAEQKAKQLEKVEKEVASLKSERDDSARTIAELKRQLTAANERADMAERKAHNNAAIVEQKRVTELEEELSDLRLEKKLAEDRAKAEVREVKEEATRQQERATVLETELRGEITNLETKLEVLRSRTEEVSSNPSGDSQIKLLRQIETLQTQYALASENWQGIEGSLTARVAALEKERDDLAKRESDVRRKAREVNSKSRKLEEELDNTSEQARSLEHELAERKDQMAKLQSRVMQLEKELENATTGFEQQKKIWEAELAQKIEEEKTKWRLEAATVATQSPVSGPGDNHNHFLTPQTPSLSGTMFSRKHSTEQSAGLHSRRGIARNVSSELLLSLDAQQPPRRMPSSQRTPGFPGTPQRQDSSSTTNGNSIGLASHHAPPSIHTVDDSADAFERTSSPHRTVADMISVSTVGAGPSVQLVERMSAAVRRLESEKAVSKEEMARLAAQRDEAREEVVALMREVDEKRSQSKLVEKLQRELREVNTRYETTLEALGEKSEQVEELQNDVDDLKKIYKDLVERTMK